MALLNRGRLFAGALFAGVLFGGHGDQAVIEPQVAMRSSGGVTGRVVWYQKEPAKLEIHEEEAIIFAIVSAVTQGVLR